MKCFLFLRKHRAIQNTLGTVLLIGLVVAAGATLAIIFLSSLSTDEGSSFFIELNEALDNNNDGFIDAMSLSAKNTGSSTSKTNFVSLNNWEIAPGYVGTDIDKDGRKSIVIMTSLKSSQFLIDETISIALSQNENFGVLSEITPTQARVPEPVTVEVLSNSEPIQGETIIFETGTGSPVSFPPTLTDENGQVRAYLMPDWYKAKTISGKESDLFHALLNKSVVIEDYDVRETIYVKVLDNEGVPIPNIRVYDTDLNQIDLGQSSDTNTSGFTIFIETNGEYLFRVEYLSVIYWSSGVEVPGSDGSIVTIQISGGDLNGVAVFGDTPVGNHKLLRLYSVDGVYLGKYDRTNSTSHFEFTGVPSGLYKLRLDYQGAYYWSTVISTSDPDLIVDFGGGELTIQVLASGSPLPNNVLTRLFRANNVSAGRYDRLNSTGFAEYGGTPSDDYRLRIDWLGQYVFTEAFYHDGSIHHLDIGGGKLNLQILAGGAPLPNNVLTRLFTANNVSTGRYDRVNSTGFAEYGAIFEGNYRLRVDWLGQYVFTESFYHDGSTQYLDVNGGRLDIQVLAGGAPLPNNVLTRLFNANNVSTGRYDRINSTGFVEYGAIFEGDYRLRVDWLGQYVFTDIFHHDGTTQYLDIGGGKLDIQVLAGGAPLPNNVLTRLFNANNVSAGRYDRLNSTGYAEYGPIFEGNYRLRIDWLGQYFFSESFYHDGSTHYLDIDGGILTIKIDINGETLPNNVLTRLFTANNVSAGRYDRLNSTGFAEYGAIPASSYRLRIDWMGNYYWTTSFIHDGSASYNLSLPGVAKISIRVSDTTPGNYIGGSQTVYLYHVNSDGTLTYTGIYATTNTSSYIEFSSIPAGNYTLGWNSRYCESFLITDISVLITDITIPDPSAF